MYAPGRDKDKKQFQAGLRSLRKKRIARDYEKPVTEEAHVGHILNLSLKLTSLHATVLQNACSRFGSAQKSPKLYLKCLSCLEKISQPPDRPLDSMIIASIAGYQCPSWSALDSVENYRDLLTCARTAAKGVSLAEWEPEIYNDAQPMQATRLRR